MGVGQTGYSATASDVNRQAGQVIVNLANAMSEAIRTGQMLGDAGRGFGEAGLVALGFSQEEADLILGAFADMDAMYQIGTGQAALEVPRDFFAKAKQLMGTWPAL